MTDTIERDQHNDAWRAQVKTKVLAALRTRSIASVEIEYDGEGDDGQIASITGLDHKGSMIDLEISQRITVQVGPRASSFPTLALLIDHYAWELLGHYHDTFYDNEGGWGRIIIDVGKGTVEIDHNDRVVEFVNTTTEV